MKNKKLNKVKTQEPDSPIIKVKNKYQVVEFGTLEPMSVVVTSGDTLEITYHLRMAFPVDDNGKIKIDFYPAGAKDKKEKRC